MAKENCSCPKEPGRRAEGMLFEKLGLCYAPQFASFLHDLMPLKKDPDVVVKDVHFETIPVKLYKPKKPSSVPRIGIIFFHGGGTILGSLRTHHSICLRLSKDCDAVVISVGYRKSPMYKYPVMKDDCVAATTHFLRSLDVYGVDPDRLVVCGDSVGGTAAAVTSQTVVHRKDLPQIRAQILIYPSLQLVDFGSPSYQQNFNVPLLTSNLALYCFCCHLDVKLSWQSVIKSGRHLPPEIWEKYRKWLGVENIPERFKKQGYKPIPRGPVNNEVYQEIKTALNNTCSPLLAEDSLVSQLPETCIVSCEYDLFRDHSLLYKKRLEALGVPVTWHHMEDGFHGVLNTFEFGLLSIPCSLRIMDLIIRFIKKF